MNRVGDSEQIVGPLAPPETLFPEVEQAFKRVSRLGQYTPEQLQQAERWIVHTAYEMSTTALASATGVPSLEIASAIPNSFFYTVADGETPDEVAARFADSDYIDYFYPLVPYEVSTFAGPPDLPNDPYLRHQWHLINTGQLVGQPDAFDIFASWGEDIHVMPVWEDGITGEGVVVAIVDDGLQINHPDIAPNATDPSLHIDLDGRDRDPSPNPNDFPFPDTHGTAVGGLAIGAGDNGRGITGVAYDATAAGIRLISGPFLTDDMIFDALNHLNDRIDIYNNSWGPGNGTRLMPLGVPFGGPFVQQALRLGATLGRDGLGSIYVFAAGNDRDIFDTANYKFPQNSRFVIAVTGFAHDGSDVSYAEGGANVFVAAPTGTHTGDIGSGLYTTDLLGERGTNSSGYLDDPGVRDFFPDIDYTSRMNGTSGSAPIASGVIALMLQANPNLSYREVMHILARSSRVIDYDAPGVLSLPEEGPPPPRPFQPDGWVTNWDTPFRDFEVDDMGLPATDPAFFTTEAGNAEDKPLPNVANGAGFFVHDLHLADLGFGHGAIDARLAVELAKNWQPILRETVPLSSRFLFPGDETGEIPSSEVICDPADIRIPGAIGGEGGFGDAWELWLCPDDPDMPPEDPPVNTRGRNVLFSMPDTLNVEWVEVRVNFREMPANALERVRMGLISPTGTHSDFINYIQDGGLPDILAEDASEETPFDWTFTTNRHWGERSGGTWEFVLENWSNDELNIDELEISVYGTRTQAGRVQGTVGLDANGDGTFNFTGLVNTEGEPIEDLTMANYGFRDPAREPLASEAIVYVDVDHNNQLTRDFRGNIVEPYFMTGADGNYYFDLPEGMYDIRVIAPDNFEIVGDDEILVEVATDPDTGRIESLGNNFLLSPEPVTLTGTIFADYNGNGRFDPRTETTADQFIVFADVNENGEFDFIDNNFNFVFDDGDEPIEPVDVTGIDGAYSLQIDTSLAINPVGYPGFEGFRGNDFYTVMVVERAGWEVTRAQDQLRSPDGPFYRVFARAGETVEDLDFFFEPDLVQIRGSIFHDVDADHRRDSGEGPASGFVVYIDLDEDGVLGVGEPQVTVPSSGEFVFPQVEPGTYIVRLIPRSGWRQSAPWDTDADQAVPHVIEIGAGDLAVLEFGVHVPGTVHGVVYHDRNGDGARDERPGSSETALSGFTVFVDMDGDGLLDNGEPRVVTGSGGAYAFQNLPAGTHVVRVLETPGFEHASPPDGAHRIEVDPSAILAAADFGMQERQPSVGTIQGFVFQDTNGNAGRDEGDRHLGGYTVFVDLDGDGVQDAGEPFGVTDALGSYAISGLEEGMLTVRLRSVAGLQPVDPATGSQSVDLGPDGLTSVDFAVIDNTTVDRGSAPPPYPDAAHRKGANPSTRFLLGAGYANDGVDFVDGTDLRPGQTYTIEVTANRTGAFLHAWIDFNGDGDWNDAGERVIAGRSLTIGVNELSFEVPENVVDGTTYARFRFGELGINNPTSEAAVGEVEDYAIQIVTAPPDPADLDGDGIVSHADGNVLRQNLGTTRGATAGMGDLDGDGDVDGHDWLNWLLAFGNGAGIGSAAAATAAPAALSEESLQNAGGWQSLAAPGTPLNERVAGGIQARIAQARSAAAERLDFSIARLSERDRGLDSIVVDDAGEIATAAESQPQVLTAAVARGVAERDLVLAGFDSSSRAKSTLDVDSGSILRELTPSALDAALAVGLGDEDWLS